MTHVPSPTKRAEAAVPRPCLARALALLGVAAALTGCAAGAPSDGSEAQTRDRGGTGCASYQFQATTASRGAACFRYLVTTRRPTGLTAFGLPVDLAFFTEPGRDPRAPIPGNTAVCVNKRLVAPTLLPGQMRERLRGYVEAGARSIRDENFVENQVNGWIPGLWEGIATVTGSVSLSAFSPATIDMIFQVSPMGLRNAFGAREVWTAGFAPAYGCHVLLYALQAPPYPGVATLSRPLAP